MDARARLRAYLEQRRELGEAEFVLDRMSVDEALGAIDKLKSLAQSQQAKPPAKQRSQHPSQQPSQQPEKRPTSRSEPASTIKPAKAVDVPARIREPSIEAQPAPSVRPARVEERGRGELRMTERDAATSGATPHSVSAATNAAVNAATDAADIGGPEGVKLVQGLVVGAANGTLFEQNPYHGTLSLDALARLITDCTRCPLFSTAKNAVPGEGDANGDFMIVGEAPGANEDESGQPFVGQAGALLTKILAAIDLSREQVFITNVLKHRPPGNRNPQPDEVEACSPYLVRQIQMVKPKVILALGTFAAQTLLESKTPIGKLRGAVHRYYGIPLIVTYHPAALLRNPAWKRPTWEDVKLARHILDTSKS